MQFWFGHSLANSTDQYPTQQYMIMVFVSNLATKFLNVLRMSNIRHLDIRIQVLLQNLFQNVCVEAKPNPWLGDGLENILSLSFILK